MDPNSTPWNAAEGSGIYHTEGGTHYVGVSNEIMLKRKEAAATPTPVPVGFGDGSGHATGPLSWVGTGNWSPGFVTLPAGDAQVVVLSQGTTAFILADPSGNQVGFGAFPPPGGQYTVPVKEAGGYVIAFGTANATDSWSATVLLPGSGGGQVVVPPVPTPNTQVLSFAGTGGGSPGSFNLTPGTVHVALTADQMTMAYIKDPWGVTLSTTVAGPYPGGSTVAITQAGTYRLDVWGPGAWSAVVTWTGTPGTGSFTLPTTQPVTTLTPWNATAATTTTTVTSIPTTTSIPTPEPDYTLVITDLILGNLEDESVSIQNTGGAQLNTAGLYAARTTGIITSIPSRRSYPWCWSDRHSPYEQRYEYSDGPLLGARIVGLERHGRYGHAEETERRGDLEPTPTVTVEPSAESFFLRCSSLSNTPHRGSAYHHRGKSFCLIAHAAIFPVMDYAAANRIVFKFLVLMILIAPATANVPDSLTVTFIDVGEADADPCSGAERPHDARRRGPIEGRADRL